MNKLVACVLASALALLASGADLSNEVGVKHWLRDALTYDDQSDTFSTNALSGVAESAAIETSAASLPVLMDEATEALRADLEPMQARLAIEAQRPVVMITGAAGLDNALDRENLTMAVVSNEWTVAADGSRHLDCYVFSNKILMSPPIVDAALMTDLGTVTNWVRGVWDGYGTRACTVELEHQNAYTNFVIVSRTYGETKVLETNVTFVVKVSEMVVSQVTNDYTRVDCIVISDNSYVSFGTSRLDDSFEIDYACPEEYLNQNQCFICARSAVGSTDGFALFIIGGKFRYDNAGEQKMIASVIPGFRHVLKMSNGRISVDGIDYFLSDPSKYREGFPVTAFGSQANAGVPNGNFLRGRVYRMAWRGEEYVPALDDNGIACFYVPGQKRYEYILGSGISYEGAGSRVEAVTNIVENTYSYDQKIALTNAVLITIDGQQPQVTLRGDKERFECYRLGFDLPPAESVRLNPWVKIGHPETGFDFGNRQLRINGAMTVTTNDVSEIGEWFTPDGNRVELTPYLDQGLLRFSDLKEDEE